MATINQSFVGAQESPYTSIPAGFTAYGTWQRLTSLGGNIRGNTFGQIVFDTYTSGLKTISAPMNYASAPAAAEWGFCAINSSRTGFSLIVKNASTTLRKEVAGSGGATIATVAATNTADATFSMDFDDSTGAITVKKNGTTVLTGTYTDTPTLKLGIQSYSSGGAQTFSTVQIDYSPAQTITSINGGNPTVPGQSGIPIVATGFPSKPDTLTATYAGGAKSITATIDSGGTANNFTITVQDRIEADDWPLNNSDVTYTFSVGAATASLTQKLVKKSTEVVLTFSGANTTNPAALTKHLTDDGFTAEGGELAYIPYGDLVLTADGGGSATSAGTFTSWFRPSTGTGAGNVYYYEWTVTESGITPSNRGMTSIGLTTVGLTQSGLTTAGL